MKMAKKLAWNKSARQYYREIGVKLNGKAHRFYLGDDEAIATANILRLEALWAGVKKRWDDYKSEEIQETDFPCWDETTLQLGEAVRKGEWTVLIEPPENLSAGELATWASGLKTYFPMIQVQVPDPIKLDEGNKIFVDLTTKMAKEEQHRHREKMRFIKRFSEPFGGNIKTKETLHDAIEAYIAWVEKTFVDIDGITTQTGKKQGERAERLKRHAKDMPLSDFDAHEIDQIIETWRTRPKKADGKPFSYSLCKHTIRLFKHFLRWLHKDKSFPRKRPADLDLDGIKIVPDAEVKYKVETYSKEEIGTLWQYASHFERQLLAMALNCGFSISEIGSLNWSEVESGHIKGLRPKTSVYGEFKLWDITKQVMGSPKGQGLVFTTQNGLSLIARTAGNNVCAKIPSAWYRLLNRIQKHHPEFKRLGFHHLRKTAGDFIRKLSDGETMGVFLRHGKPVKSDVLADIYSNRHFQKVFEAQDKFWDLLKDVITPLEDVTLSTKLSPAQIRQIRKLKSQGFTTKHLSEQFGVAKSTIQSHCRKRM